MKKGKKHEQKQTIQVIDMALVDLITELADAFENLGETLYEIRDRLASPDAKRKEENETRKSGL